MTKNLLSLFLLFFGFNTMAQTPGSGVTDIDGNQYPSVIIGSQEWMAENLRTTHYANGQVIQMQDNYLFDTGSSWPMPLWGYFNGDSQNENVYGKLYNFYAVDHPGGICPTGWRVPTIMDWGDLFTYLDGGNDNYDSWENSQNNVGGKLKSTSTLWTSPNSGANNSTGFSALPSGDTWGSTTGTYGQQCLLWSTTEQINIYVVQLYYDSEHLAVTNAGQEDGLGVRCIKNTSLVNVPEIQLEKREIIKIFDLMGRETEFKPNTVLIYVYSDGTTEKVFKTE